MPNPARRLVDAVAPPRLGRGFRWLLSASILNNAGDGVVLAAGPLLVASLTRDPFLVSLALFMEYLPVLLFALIGGVAADRFDRRRMVIVANLGRAFVFAVLFATIVTGAVNIAVVLAQNGARVGLLDADIYGPNIPTMMGLTRLPAP